MAVTGQPTVLTGQPTAVTGQLVVVTDQPLLVGHQTLAITNQLLGLTTKRVTSCLPLATGPAQHSTCDLVLYCCRQVEHH